MKNRKLADLLAFKASLFEMFVMAVLVALGVNILSSGVTGYFNLSYVSSVVAGCVLIVVGVLILIRNLRPQNNGVYSVSGVVCINDETSEMIPIEGYEVSEEIDQAVVALCSENKAFKKIWSESPIGSESSSKRGAVRKSPPKSNALLREAIEYYALNKLSMHLEAYFNSQDLVSNDELVTLERNEVSQVLLDNRFLDLFSRPMEEREPFTAHGFDSTEGKVVYAFGPGGAIFEHFEILLPKGSSIGRDDSGLVIKTPRFSLTIESRFRGMNAVFPRRFEELYLGANSRAVSVYKIGLGLAVNFYPASLLTARGWDYYWWLDSFLNEIEESFSKDKFLARISWEQNAALILMNENAMNDRGCDFERADG
ncbi:hypothetical protein JET68_08780 [Pseudomonas monteilii]|uniref:hypothetical protein n=1 Tax=Pseudomonas TaxID=286 RepID=UPI0018E6BD39|nr:MULTISPECIES: hypothetical protein [Pseudomonas]MBI6918893.1 hypothetical protein [Pseudomonas monteilii]MCE0939502.1 hypothetical protein [Pseudomonas kurunegalensis]